MASYDLSTDQGLRAALEAIGSPRVAAANWIGKLAAAIEGVRAANVEQRADRDFQRQLWDDEAIAKTGQGQISVERALSSEEFRSWFATRSAQPLPGSTDERRRFLNDFYEDTKEQLGPYLDGKIPHLKVFRAMAVLFPEAMTTIAGTSAMAALARHMGVQRGLTPVERHLFVRRRLDDILGPTGSDATELAERVALPWLLYEVVTRGEPGAAGSTSASASTSAGPPHGQLVPLPAARRRRGLTAFRGSFAGVLSILEFVRPGVTRQELMDFLRSNAPTAKAATLSAIFNSLQGELRVIRLDGDKYVLTDSGESVLESQDPSYLADWLLTGILGIDKAITVLRDSPGTHVTDLSAAIKKMNPGWTSTFMPAALINWLRSFGVVTSDQNARYSLTPTGEQWAARIHWEPEPLALDTVEEIELPPAPALKATVSIPPLRSIIESVQDQGQFDASLVARLHAGLWSHPRRHFGILTGLSGSGKTLLARAYGKALSNGEAESRLLTHPVQPGWYDPGALLGYPNPLHGEEYVRTPFLNFLLKAADDPERPYVAVLDEMNLSHPEQYMAPLLSAMETGDPLRLHAEGDFFDGIPSALPYPSNIVLIGTVNMDETTHGLSDKVLDRAFVLEFWDIDLDSYPRWGSRKLPKEHEARAREVLTGLMAALAPVRLHFGWRVVDDTLDYLTMTADAAADLPFDAALDGVVYAKVLPKLRGEDSPRLREAFAACEAVLKRLGLESSRRKVADLARDLQTTGSARFWR